MFLLYGLVEVNATPKNTQSSFSFLKISRKPNLRTIERERSFVRQRSLHEAPCATIIIFHALEQRSYQLRSQSVATCRLIKEIDVQMRRVLFKFTKLEAVAWYMQLALASTSSCVRYAWSHVGG